MENNMIGFFGASEEYGFMSNWYHRKFTVDNIEYIGVEQYMMYQKAVLFGDTEIAKQIMKSTNFKNIKALGRIVSDFNSEIWDKHKMKIVHDGVFAKFSQNEDLKKLLLDTGDKLLVECSPYDKIWGIGIGLHNPDRFDKTKWKGQNLLGKVLMQVREELRDK